MNSPTAAARPRALVSAPPPRGRKLRAPAPATDLSPRPPYEALASRGAPPSEPTWATALSRVRDGLVAQLQPPSSPSGGAAAGSAQAVAADALQSQYQIVLGAGGALSVEGANSVGIGWSLLAGPAHLDTCELLVAVPAEWERGRTLRRNAPLPTNRERVLRFTG